MTTRIVLSFSSFVIICASSYAQWVTDYTPYKPAVDLFYTDVVDTEVVWVVGSQSMNSRDTAFVLVKSPGYSWYGGGPTNLPGGFLYSAIAGIDSVTAFVGNENGKIFKTSDKGLNWTQILDAGDYALVADIRFSKINKNIGYIFCDPPASAYYSIIYKTTDFGVHWSLHWIYFTNSYIGYWRSACVTDSTHAWLGLINTSAQFSNLVLTTSGGISWQYSSYYPNSNCVQAISFKNDNTYGLAIFTNNDFLSQMYSSSDGGHNWSRMNNFEVRTMYETALLSIPQTSTWYYLYPTLDSSMIYKSTNDGMDWDSMVIDNPDDMLSHMDAVRFNNKIYAYAVSRSGNIYKLIDTTEVIGIRHSSKNIPEFFNLYQNYPNPFNPVTRIKFDVPSSNKGLQPIVQLRVFDILGREIASLVNESLKPGSYEVEWDGTGFASGIYFYRLTAADFSDVKKMVLLQ